MPNVHQNCHWHNENALMTSEALNTRRPLSFTNGLHNNPTWVAVRESVNKLMRALMGVEAERDVANTHSQTLELQLNTSRSNERALSRRVDVMATENKSVSAQLQESQKKVSELIKENEQLSQDKRKLEEQFALQETELAGAQQKLNLSEESVDSLNATAEVACEEREEAEERLSELQTRMAMEHQLALSTEEKLRGQLEEQAETIRLLQLQLSRKDESLNRIHQS